MGSWRQQALIEAPIDAVWRLVGDPRRYPEWASKTVLDVTGVPTLEPGATFQQVSRVAFGRTTTTFVVDALDDLHEIRLRCLSSGYYSHWLLTEARSETFTEVEIGMEPTALGYRTVDKVMGKRWYRKMSEESVDALRTAAQLELTRQAPG
jgi:Polyketide cyclase / dehydrase and lipid transport